MGIHVVKLGLGEVEDLLRNEEGHFTDFKQKDVTPAKASRTVSTFANTAGGELYVGLGDTTPRSWIGFDASEEANGYLQVFNEMFPLGEDIAYAFLAAEGKRGLILHVQVSKTKDVKYASNRIAYVRVGAQNQPVGGEALEKLRLTKGIISFEDSLVNVESGILVESPVLKDFVGNVVPRAEPEPWLKKQRLTRDGKPTVAGVLLFADEPQVYLPKRSAIKIYRYKTNVEEGSRETLAFDPITVEGCAYRQIYDAVEKTVGIIQEINILGPSGLEKAKYPPETLHEIITNAVLHRDYSVTDDIDVRIFDNRIEVESPGRLPGHVTVENILTEQFARNPTLVRIINKFPNPPNKDVGEGLNTAFEAMRKLQLKPPLIEERAHSVVVFIRHEPLATAEEIIMDYLETQDSITNSIGRKLCHIGSENVMKKVFERMMERNMIERVPGKQGRAAAYQKVKGSMAGDRRS